MKTRSEEAKIKKEKPVEAKKEKPSKIQFKRKGKIIEPPTPKALVNTRKRKKEQEKKSVATDEEEIESKESMEIATTMQSREKKKRMKEQQKEAETIKHAVEILSRLLPKTDIESFAKLIDKLGQLVNELCKQMKTFEDAEYVYVEKEYKKQRT
ncbi:uncharacterized protein LOC131874233 [Cryptomeria japonica]|uniref:uncharacterized protein LOC131874233 n=1 Tax=Cryptomeria japonica TaxID=3369 RepID=UPI0027DA0A87|nr:uncharacterized protein LOC131874233 [Cryptomeria japonica]